MTTTSKHANLAAALAAFQAEVPTVAKGNTAAAFGGYKYADLTDVTERVLPTLAKHGLSFLAAPTLIGGGLAEQSLFVLDYSLMHESGESVTGKYPLPSGGKPQEIGSAITYARRYALCAVTGVAPGGDDDDAAAAQVAHTEPKRAKAPTAWRKLITDATTVDELKAIHGQAAADGWLSDEVLTQLTHRKNELTEPVETAPQEG